MKYRLCFWATCSLLGLIGCQSEDKMVPEGEDTSLYSVWDGKSKTIPADYSDSTRIFTIIKASDLAWLSAATHPDSSYNGFEGYTIRLGGNLDLGGICDGEKWLSSGKKWTPIGSSTRISFKGNFDGAGYKIRNLYMESSVFPEMGLFGKVSGSLSNITVESGSVRATSSARERYFGAVCGYSSGVLSGCINKARIGTSDKISYMGGICGHAEEVNNCKNYGRVYTEEITATDSCRLSFMGGIAGEVNKASGCVNEGNVTSEARDTTWIGGIAAKTNEGVSSCTNHAKLGYEAWSGAARVYVGGICALSQGQIVDCENTGRMEIVGLNTNMGGISYTAKVVKNCRNEGELGIMSSGLGINCAGIVPKCDTVSFCENLGNILVSAQNSDVYVNGICSYVLWVTDCKNFGDIEVAGRNSAYVSGVANKVTFAARSINTGDIYCSAEYSVLGGILVSGSQTTLLACVNKGVLVAPDGTVGGIIGMAQYSGSVIKLRIYACVSKGNIANTYYWGGPLWGRLNAVALSCLSTLPLGPKKDDGMMYSYFKTPIPSGATASIGGGQFSATAWPDSTMPGWGDIVPEGWNAQAFGAWENPWSSLGSWNNGDPIYPTLKIE